MEPGWFTTLGTLAAGAALFVWANRVGRRPVDFNRPRLVSPVLVMGLALVVVILMLAHIVTLLTGQPFQGGGF